MALGIVSDDIFETEVVKIPQVSIVPVKSPGRREGDTEIPDSIRKIIGDTAIESGRKDAIEMAEFFKVSNSSASAYSNGVTSTASYNQPDVTLKSHITKTKERLSKRAARGIRRAFDALTDEKLTEASAPELASVIRAFSGVIKDLEPETKSGSVNNSGPILVLYAPKMVSEDKFDVITISE